MNDEFDKAVRCAIQAREHRRIARLWRHPDPTCTRDNTGALAWAHESQARRYERVVRRIADEALKEHPA